MDRPWPVPRPTSLVVKNGSKMRARMSSGMPPPVSPMAMTTSFAFDARAHGDLAARAASLDRVGDGVRRIHHEIQHDLVDLAAVAGHGRKLAVVGFHIRDVLYSLRAITSVLAIARLRSTGLISCWSACEKSFIERTISAMRCSPSATRVSAGGSSSRMYSTSSSSGYRRAAASPRAARRCRRAVPPRHRG